MRFFQRRRDDMDTEQQGSDDAIAPHNLSRTMDSYYKNKSDFDQGDRVPSFRKDSLVSSSSGQAQQRFMNTKKNMNIMHGSKTKTVIESDDCPASNNRQSIGKLVSKLNCSSSKKDDEEELNRQSSWQRATNTPPSQRTGSSPASSLGRTKTRPVLITVKDRDAKQPYETTTSADQSYSVTPETKNSFPAKEIPPRPSSCLSSTRKRLHIDKESNKNRGAGGKWDNYGYISRNKNNKNTSAKDLDAIRIAQGLARRERWKRGLEMELIKNSVTIGKRLNKNNNSNNNEGDSTDDISWAESWTQGSNTTGTSTTGESSSGDDWTNSTDDSRMFYCNHNRNSQQYGRKSWHNSNGRCMTNEQMMRSVAEDVGVFAGLLFSDGVACLGTAAAITKETVADCNRKHH